MSTGLIIAVDPSRIGKKTSGCGISVGTILLESCLLVKNITVPGTAFSNQGDYIESVINTLESILNDALIANKTIDYIMVRVEDYVEYQKAATKFTDNKVSKMIGAIEYWVRTKKEKLNIHYRAVKAQVIKTRWPNIILWKKELIDGEPIKYPKLIDFNISRVNKKIDIIDLKCYNYINSDGTQHSLDAYRHLIDEFHFGKWKEALCKK